MATAPAADPAADPAAENVCDNLMTFQIIPLILLPPPLARTSVRSSYWTPSSSSITLQLTDVGAVTRKGDAHVSKAGPNTVQSHNRSELQMVFVSSAAAHTACVRACVRVCVCVCVCAAALDTILG